MISSGNKHLMFDLLYRHIFLNEDVTSLNTYIEALRKELTITEAQDIVSLNPADFNVFLKKEWESYVAFRKNNK